jgi:cytosine/adenosine deaminase-related metal-dependent hydrolase
VADPTGHPATTAGELARLGGTAYVLAPEQVLLPGGFTDRTAVAVGADGTIERVGPVAELRAAYPDRHWLELPGRAVVPGFVDAHHHLTQAFGGPLAFGEPSEIFKRVWLPLETALTEQEVVASARLAALESLRGGFTTIADAGTRSRHDVGLIAEAATEVGVRCVLPVVCHDVGVDETQRRAILRRAEAHLARWASTELVHPGLAVAIPEAATDKTLVEVSRMCEESGAVLQTHLNEHLAGVERSLLATGRRPAEHLHELGVLGPWLLAAHATMLTAREIRLFAETGAAISYNPVASAWKGNAVAPALTLVELGVRVGLGTDATRGDGFRLLDAAETAQRLATSVGIGDPDAGRGQLWLDLATRGGAEVTGLARTCGAIEKGRAADLLVVRTDVPELTPSWDLAWELVRLGNRDLIDAVLVAGRARIVGGAPVGWDAATFLDEARELAERAVARAGLRRPRSSGDERA